MSLFEAIVTGLAGAFFVACLLLGVLYPGTGADRLFKRSRPPHPPVDDDETAELLAAANARRAANGKPPLRAEDLR